MPRLASYTFPCFKLHHRHLFEERWSHHICTYYYNAIYYVINGKTSLIPTAPVLLLEPTFGRLAVPLYHYCYALLIIIVQPVVYSYVGMLVRVVVSRSARMPRLARYTEYPRDPCFC
jgi:hypothetical protein